MQRFCCLCVRATEFLQLDQIREPRVSKRDLAVKFSSVKRGVHIPYTMDVTAKSEYLGLAFPDWSIRSFLQEALEPLPVLLRTYLILMLSILASETGDVVARLVNMKTGT